MEPIAIIGIGCRFGAATDPESFFDLLRKGTDSTCEVPEDRWSLRSFYDPDRRIQGKLSTFRGGFLPQIDRFDAQFFGISPREAACMDPQQRLMLEVSWEALEDAGIAPEKLAGRDVGVFAGAFTLDYKAIQLGRQNRHLIDTHTATGAMMTMVSNRLSYAFDFRGPSVSVDTACSSSLVAVHLACQSLRAGECSVALAGGVNVMVTPEYTIAESKGGFLSPDGRSKPFSAAADGYARAEGAGVVVLKPLAAALADGDPVYAVIRGSAVNQDGHTNGITVPSGDAQARLIRDACARAGVAPAQVQYVEAHGTGTPVGDPIEAEALGTALGAGRDKSDPCIVGSVKGNLGHLEAAAGVAGLIKASLCLKHREIPPNLHFEHPNPKIRFDDLALRVPTTLEKWPAGDGPSLAGVNSFGFGGTNAHVILEQAPVAAAEELREITDTARPSVLFPISARTPPALAAMAANLRDFARTVPGNGAALDDMFYTASLHRSHHDYRLGVVASSCEEFAGLIDAHLSGELRSGISTGVRTPAGRPRLAFVCTGMGPQWWAMGRRLFHEEPLFRRRLLECDEVFRREADWSLLAELMADEAHSRMAETQVAQTANFAIQVALAELWNAWGIAPDAICGHSVGEVSSAYLSGALTFEDAIRVSFHRSRLQQKMTGFGAMMAVGMPVEEAAGLIASYGNRVSIAAVNSPSSTTLSGDREVMQELADRLATRHIFNRMLKVNVAYHSAQMEMLRDELLESLANISPRAATLPLYSTVTGTRIDGAGMNADYWWQNVRQPVEFRAVMNTLMDEGFDWYLEVGPHPVLASSITECLGARGKKGSTACTLRRGEDERATMLASLGALYTAGFPVRWEAFQTPSARLVRLPAYPWQRERHWSESEESLADRIGKPVHPLLGQRLPSPNPSWEGEINPRALDYLADHSVRGAAVFPGAAYVEMGLAAAHEYFGGTDYAVEKIRFKRALFLPEGERPKVQITLDSQQAGFEIFSRTGASGWVRNAAGSLRQVQAAASGVFDFAAIQARCPRHHTSGECYRQFADQGFNYGPAFQKIEQIWLGDGQAAAQFGNLDAPELEYRLHPAVLDACFQVLVATNPFYSPGNAHSATYLPVGIERIRIHRRPEGRMWAWARLDRRSESQAVGSIVLCDEAGNVVLEIEGFEVQVLDAAEASLSPEEIGRSLYQVEWRTLAREAAQDQSPRTGRWLLFADRAGIADALAMRIQQQGGEVIIVEPGTEYQFLPESGRRTLDPKVPAHFERLLKDIRSAELPLTGVAHLWSLDAAVGEPAAGGLDRAEALGCVSVMHLVQALSGSGLSPRLWLVTRGAQAVGDEQKTVAVAQSALWGLGRVIGHQEHLGMWGGLIDLDPAAPAGEVEQILDEMLRPEGEDQVAFRAAGRHVARLERCRELTPALPARLRPDASYLITGGLGALGLLTARWMVEQGARRLILMGRTPLPERAAWNTLDPAGEPARRIAAIRELESMGATVVIAQVDVADEAQLSDYLRGYEQEAWPPIRGVVHSAGVVRDQLLLQMDAASFGKVLGPKVRGAWNLHRLMDGAPLDFFVLFSSIGSLVVSTGQGNYAAGNAFLDALAHHRRRQGLPALSINWGPWAVGMVNHLNLGEHYAARGLELIQPRQGMQVLGRLFGQQIPQAAVVSANWPLLFEFQPKVSPMVAHLGLEQAGAETEASAAGVEDFMQSLLSAEPESQPAMVEGHLQDLAAKVLRLDSARIDARQPLNAMGLDSMMATEFKNRVELSLGVPVSVLDLLKGVSIGELAEMLMPALVGDAAEMLQLLEEVEQLPENTLTEAAA